MKRYLSPLLLLFIVITSLCHSQTPVQTATLWGMTQFGGVNDSGVVFRYDISTGKDTVVHSFGSATAGAYPFASLIKAKNGLLYGTTSEGGANNTGAIFSYNDSTNIYTNLYNFAGDTGGQSPYGSLLQANNGLLYGMTAYGGKNIAGVIFSYNILTGTEINLYDFGNGTDGQYPYGALIQASNGLLYGMTELGGVYDGGIIFSFNDTTGVETDIHDFNPNSDTDGYAPGGSLIQANNGLLYGMTNTGGIKINKDNSTNNAGIIFSYDISTGVETDVHDFGVSKDGKYPFGSLVEASNGLLYGLTQQGGTKFGGTIFSFDTSTGTETDLHDFGLDTIGHYPHGSLIEASNGLLYGMTGTGGLNNDGTVFSFNSADSAVTDIYEFNGAIGNSPLGDLLEVDFATILVTPLTDSICAGDSVTFVATGAATYTWAPSTGLSATTGDTVIAKPAANTTYTITGSINGHIYTTTVTVLVYSIPVITVNTPPSICNGESTSLVASGAAAYTWAPGTGLNATTGDSVIANPTITTTYTLIGTNICGADTAKIIVTVLPTVTKPTFRQHGDTLISSSQFGNQWYRNDTLLVNDTSQDLVISSTGRYWVSVSNEANGCSTPSDTITIDTVEGINQLSVTGNQLSVYPNPFSNQLTIISKQLTIDEVDITDELGQVLLKFPGIYSDKIGGGFRGEIDLSNFSNGVYFITVINKTGRAVVSIIRQN